MEFKVIDKTTGEEPTSAVIEQIAEEGGLLTMDIDSFALREDGYLILMDDCGNTTFCDMDRFEIEPDIANAPEVTMKDLEDFCNARNLRIVSNEFLESLQEKSGVIQVFVHSGGM